MVRRPRLAVFKFASCDGCQLSLLDAEDELLELCDRVDIAHFAEASSDLQSGPYDVALVEGSITTDEDAARILRVRRDSHFLITIGACATAGGIQALRAWGDLDEWVASVYPRPEFIQTLATSTAIAEHVHVDFELHGCPINHHQLIDVLIAVTEGRRPNVPSHSVCLDCKRRGNVCHVVTRSIACLGPITNSGCGAICPTYNRGCYGCYGPSQPANTSSLLKRFQEFGQRADQLVPLLRSFNAAAPAFRHASDQLAILKD
ncbi:NADH-quinone oxidoreductase subunit B family protein [Schlesneria paludicola]|uniref:NADH-quinone oxidoreductase subunit B family protein n=1 Tax=Schlesneria paludicola TaxID=360056 RepID=UPI00029B0810|nr:oxidoreductase [Schlesneria paludicola]